MAHRPLSTDPIIYRHVEPSPEICYDTIVLTEGKMSASTKQLPLTIPPAKIEAFCRRHRISQLALFGSVLRDDFGPDSDVDVLVEFEPEHIPGLAFFAMQDELSRILNRPVDLNTRQFVSPHFRQQVENEAEIIYDQT